jgi:hypothetical protein
MALEVIIMEIWKDIKGYEGIYQASDFGRIRTVEGKVTHSVRHGIRHWKSRILKYRGHNPRTGHRVTLWKDKKSKDFLVARLVAFTFYDKDIKDRKLTVNHKDGNRMNNYIDNLELISVEENIRHAFREGLMPQRKVKLLDLKTNEILEFISFASCGRFLGKCNGFISERVARKKFIIDDKYKIIETSKWKKSHKKFNKGD